MNVTLGGYIALSNTTSKLILLSAYFRFGRTCLAVLIYVFEIFLFIRPCHTGILLSVGVRVGFRVLNPKTKQNWCFFLNISDVLGFFNDNLFRAIMFGNGDILRKQFFITAKTDFIIEKLYSACELRYCFMNDYCCAVFILCPCECKY